MPPDADTIITAAPTERIEIIPLEPKSTGYEPGRSGHPVLWFAVGLGLFTIDAMLLAGGLRLTWMLLHL